MSFSVSGCCSGGGDVCRWGRHCGLGEEKLRKIKEENGKIVVFNEVLTTGSLNALLCEIINPVLLQSVYSAFLLLVTGSFLMYLPICYSHFPFSYILEVGVFIGGEKDYKPGGWKSHQ